ncbi:MAG: hypothetical protein OHK0039_26100 [Bacteroidia bacterium]
MKRVYIILTLILPVWLMSCNQGRIKQLESENLAMREERVVQDSLLSDFMATFNAFEENISQIRERESLVNVQAGNPEFRQAGKEQIVSDIQMINALLAQNRYMIDSLEAKISQSDGKLSELRVMVSRLRKQLDEKDQEVNTLKEQLVAMNFEKETLERRVETLTVSNRNMAEINQSQQARLQTQGAQIDEQSDVIERQVEEMNTAFYIKGTDRDLKKQNILDKDGGFLGIGGTKRLNPDFAPDGFTRIDITEIRSIPVETKKVNIVTNHPSDSYTLNQGDKGVESIEITDPTRFWKNSKYLVVVVN